MPLTINLTLNFDDGDSIKFEKLNPAVVNKILMDIMYRNDKRVKIRGIEFNTNNILNFAVRG